MQGARGSAAASPPALPCSCHHPPARHSCCLRFWHWGSAQAEPREGWGGVGWGGGQHVRGGLRGGGHANRQTRRPHAFAPSLLTKPRAQHAFHLLLQRAQQGVSPPQQRPPAKHATQLLLLLLPGGGRARCRLLLLLLLDGGGEVEGCRGGSLHHHLPPKHRGAGATLLLLLLLGRGGRRGPAAAAVSGPPPLAPSPLQPRQHPT